MKRAAIYTRFSSENQDQNSIEMQERAIADFAAKNGIDIEAAGRFSDEAETGRDDNREDFIRMFKALKSGELKVDTLILYKMSRLFRSVELWSIYEAHFERMGIEIISVTEPLPENNGLAKLYKTMIRGFDQFTSDNIGALSLDGTKQVVRNGYWSGGPAPFGYTNQDIENTEQHTKKDVVVVRGTLARNEREAAVVVRAFEIAAETGKGGSLIYKQIAAEIGGPVLGRHGKPLGANGINAILRNPIYKGHFVYNDFGYRMVPSADVGTGQTRYRRYAKPQEQWIVQQNETWRLVSDELWDAVQKARFANEKIRPGFGRGNKRASYALTGLVICGVCGNNCGGKWQKSKNESFSEDSVYYYYRCRDAMNGSEECPNKTKIRGKELESAVLNKLLAELLNEQFIADIAKEIVEQRRLATAGDGNRVNLEARRRQITDEQNHLIELAAKVGKDIESLAVRLNACELERAEIDRQLSILGTPAPILDLDTLKPIIRRKLAKAHELFRSSLAIDDLRCALKRWIEVIRIDADGQVFVRWKASAVYDLLEIPYDDVRNGGGWNQPTPFRTPLESLAAWHPLLPAPAVATQTPMIVGFSGFSGVAYPMPSSFAGSGVIGFSGFSGTPAA